MRKRAKSGALSVNAVAGAHVVLLGLNIDTAKRKGLRGFAIWRHDVTENESYWMSGMKTFRSVEPHPAKGRTYSSEVFPIQSFQWADYSAKPDHDYEYKVVAMYGAPAALTHGDTAIVKVHTEGVQGALHSVFFNRGSSATQEYARRFHNRPPAEAGQEAYDWLSRGLVEGILDFIARAKDKTFSLRGAFYEFQSPVVLKALRDAHTRSAAVEIVFDDIDNDSGPSGANETAIKAAKITALTVPRTNGTLMHNKFIVLLKNKKPQAVLFGSTNLTENGIYGHANCAHIIEDAAVAQKYLDYLDVLKTDPVTSAGNTYKPSNEQMSPAPPPANTLINGMNPVYSPRPNLNALNWYADLAGKAKAGLFMTFAFGMNQLFQRLYVQNDDVLRFGLMEKEWNGANKQPQIDAVRAAQRMPNTTIAIGNRIPLNGFDEWLGEMAQVTDHVNVHWVHLKFMLVDPLSAHPIVVTGSANFSNASTTTNDENMMVIRDDTRVADIYLGEFMRLYSHYAFREAVKIFLDKNPGQSPDDMPLAFLIEGANDWTAPYFDPHDSSGRMARRLYFA